MRILKPHVYFIIHAQKKKKKEKKKKKKSPMQFPNNLTNSCSVILTTSRVAYLVRLMVEFEFPRVKDPE